MKIACIYHSIDQDGYMSAAIVKHWFNQQEVSNKQGEDYNTIDFIGYNHGQPIPNLEEYNKVIMVDISFNMSEMTRLSHELGNNFIWIDHHISSINEWNKVIEPNPNHWYIEGLRDTKYAACELTWKYFFSNEEMPEIVRLLGRYDCFGHKGTNEELEVLEFQYGARQVITNFEDAYEYLKRELSEQIDYQYKVIDGIWESGQSIYQYLCTEAKQVYNNGFPITLMITDVPENVGYPTYKFICINKERFNPINFGIDYHKDGYDGCVCFHYDGIARLWRFSLYNDNGLVDCSIIAKQYGGGGHKGASGFVLNNEEFNKFINNK